MDGNYNNQEEIIVPKQSNKVPITAEETEKKPRKLSTITGILAAVLGVAVIVSAIILISNNTRNDNPGNGSENGSEMSTSPEVEVVYSTPEDAEDAGEAYLEHLEEEKTNAEDYAQVFDAEIQSINFLIIMEEYSEAESKLDAIDRDGLTTEQTYRLYNMYSRLYEANENAEKYSEYHDLLNDTREKLIEEQQEQ